LETNGALITCSRVKDGSSGDACSCVGEASRAGNKGRVRTIGRVNRGIAGNRIPPLCPKEKGPLADAISPH